MAESLYDILGVAKDATDDAIRKTYRKLARKHHPDVNPGDKAAEDKFKRMASAYEVLSDAKKRAAYDEFGEASLQGGFDAVKAREYSRWQHGRQQTQGFNRGPAEFDFAELFNRSRGPSRGSDMRASMQMELQQVIAGTEVSLDVPTHGTVRVRIPSGAEDGSVIRIPGKGAPGARGGPPGDLVIDIGVKPHPRVRREGLDLHMDLPVTLDEAYNGASIEVPTFEGNVVLKIPPQSRSGAKLRLRGKGIARKDTRGDFLIALDVRMPDKQDDALSAALRASADAYSKPVREETKL